MVNLFPEYAHIIPTDAGSTLLRHQAYAPMQDHPHGCGEHHGDSGCVAGDEGSSPRMRGAQYPVLPAGVAVRIIPADAGSTSHASTRI